MRIVFRADASFETGTGHVMRCLTLLRECVEQGHEAILITNMSGVDWLEETLIALRVQQIKATNPGLSSTEILALSPDVVVVDSYDYLAEQISQLNEDVPVVMFVDGDNREIIPTLFIDQNLGAENSKWVQQSKVPVLAGSRYSLVRPEILAVKRNSPWKFTEEIPRILVFMGGTDPHGVTGFIAGILASNDFDFVARIVVPPEQIAKLRTKYAGNETLEFIGTSRNFETELGMADIVISATGTSSWEVCTLGIPALFIAVAENQQEGLHQIELKHLGLTVDVVRDLDEKKEGISSAIRLLLSDKSLRKEISQNSSTLFDGLGANRISKFLCSLNTVKH